MAEWSTIIQNNPIGAGLNSVRQAFDSICESEGLSPRADSLDQLNKTNLQKLLDSFLRDALGLPAASQLPSFDARGTIRDDLLRIQQVLATGGFDLERVKPLFRAVFDGSSDVDIWNATSRLSATTTPPPRIVPIVQQTPLKTRTSSVTTSNEFRKDFNSVLKQELRQLFPDINGFVETLFGDVPQLAEASEEVFQNCTEGDSPLFSGGRWVGWPANPNQDAVLNWLAATFDAISRFAKAHRPHIEHRRKLLNQPNKLIQGSVAERKLDVALIDEPSPAAGAGTTMQYNWSQILLPGELKMNPAADTGGQAWFDLARYAREVLSSGTRRFVLGFTLCGPLMRLWHFDRLGGIGSEKFDVNQDGQKLVRILLGFLWMDKQDLGFDPTIQTEGTAQFIEIERNGHKERLIIDCLMLSTRCIVGRATTCWMAHLGGSSAGRPLVVKDSWQHPEREEEGKILRDVTRLRLNNVARYYHHETVQVRGADDDILSNVRRGLSTGNATPFKFPDGDSSRGSRTGAGTKRSSSSRAADSSAQSGGQRTKRQKLQSRFPARSEPGQATTVNREHRRVVLLDYGEPIYRASSRVALLAGLEGCIRGHQALHEAGILHRDISINNLMINENESDPARSSFLIDLDLAIREARDAPSGAQGRTGTRAFMAIGVLRDQPHSFMHDLESFFWVLFWICIHYDGSGNSTGPTEFDQWNYQGDRVLSSMKLGLLNQKSFFLGEMHRCFMPHYVPLITVMMKLREAIFPNGAPYEEPEPELYSSMIKILQEAQQDPEVFRHVPEEEGEE